MTSLEIYEMVTGNKQPENPSVMQTLDHFSNYYQWMSETIEKIYNAIDAPVTRDDIIKHFDTMLKNVNYEH